MLKCAKQINFGGFMSKVDNTVNIEIANNFIRRYGAIFSKKQIRVLIERISTKESRTCKHVLENGSKRLSFRPSNTPTKSGYEFDIVVDTIGERKEIIDPRGNVTVLRTRSIDFSL